MKLQTIIAKLKKDKNSCLELSDQNFSNEIILDQNLQSSILGGIHFLNCEFEKTDFMGSWFATCIFENCTFNNVIFRKCEFWNCHFKSCGVMICNLTRINFYTNILTNCQFINVDFGGGHLMECTLNKVTFDNINFERTIVSDFKTKNTVFFNLQFDPNFPMKFYKLNSSECMEVSDSPSFEELIEKFCNFDSESSDDLN